jgi:hypothetical protein
MDDDLKLRARALIDGYLAGRSLPPEVLGPIEQAVAEQLREGLAQPMGEALKHLIDTYADIAVGAGIAATDDNPPTTTEVDWTSIGQLR